MATTNLYKKLIQARELFLEEKIKKSGKNKFQGFSYFELADIIPSVIKIFKEVGIININNFFKDEAVLKLVDIENPSDYITFQIPLEKVTSLKGQNEIQAIGSVVTYARRYLYLVALDIAEIDEIDRQDQRINSKPKTVLNLTNNNNVINLSNPIDETQIKTIEKIKEKAKDYPFINEMLNGVDVLKLNNLEASELIKNIVRKVKEHGQN